MAVTWEGGGINPALFQISSASSSPETAEGTIPWADSTPGESAGRDSFTSSGRLLSS